MPDIFRLHPQLCPPPPSPCSVPRTLTWEDCIGGGRGGLPCSLTSPGSSGNGARGERELEVRGQTLCSPGPSLGIAAGWPSPSRLAAVRCHLLAALSPFRALRPEGGDSTQHSGQPGSCACPCGALPPAHTTPCRRASTELPPDTTMCGRCFLLQL